MIAHLYPGAGITPWNYLTLTVEWWLTFATPAKAYALESEKQTRQYRKIGGSRGFR